MPRVSRASLTESEKAQLRQLVLSGRTDQAARARALAARPDLSEDEATDGLAGAMIARPFDAEHRALLREVLFGPASLASRSALATPVARALLLRAEALLSARPAEEDLVNPVRPAEFDELTQIYAFIGRDIASAGNPPAAGHDVTAGIEDSVFERIASAFASHVDRFGNFLRLDRKISPLMAPVRAQFALTTERVGAGWMLPADLARLLGIAGEKRSLFDRFGLIVEDAGALSEARLHEIAQLWAAVAGTAGGIDLLYLQKKTPSSQLFGTGILAMVAIDSEGERPSGEPSVPRSAAPSKLTRPPAQVVRGDALLSQVALAALRAAHARRGTGSMRSTGNPGISCEDASRLDCRSVSSTPNRTWMCTCNGAASHDGSTGATSIATTFGDAWSAGDWIVRRLSGRPRFGASGADRLVVRSDKPSDGFDAVGVGDALSDVHLTATARVRGSAGIGLRGTAGERGYRGFLMLLGLLVGGSAQPSATLVWADGQGGGIELIPPFALTASEEGQVRIDWTLSGDQLRLDVGGVARAISLRKWAGLAEPSSSTAGVPFVTARPGGEIELFNLKIEDLRAGVAKPAPPWSVPVPRAPVRPIEPASPQPKK